MAQQGLSFHLPTLKAIACSEQGQSLSVLASSPSVGKTSLSLGMGLYEAIQSKRVVGFLSLEESLDSLAKRQFLRGALSGDTSHERNRYDLKIQRYIDPQSDTSQHFYVAALEIPDAQETEAMLLWFVNRFDLDLLFVDYLGLLTAPTTPETSLRECLSRLQIVRRIARTNDVDIVALSQARRKSDGRPPDPADLTGIPDLFSVVDSLFLLHREKGSFHGESDNDLRSPGTLSVWRGPTKPIRTIAMTFSDKDRQWSLAENL
jgi:replicative DNA helicase